MDNFIQMHKNRDCGRSDTFNQRESRSANSAEKVMHNTFIKAISNIG